MTKFITCDTFMNPLFKYFNTHTGEERNYFKETYIVVYPKGFNS